MRRPGSEDSIGTSGIFFKSKTYRPKSFVSTTQPGSACTDLPDSDSAVVELPLISSERESNQAEGVSNLYLWRGDYSTQMGI